MKHLSNRHIMNNNFCLFKTIIHSLSKMYADNVQIQRLKLVYLNNLLQITVVEHVIIYFLVISMYNHQNVVSDFVHLPPEAFLFKPRHSGSPHQRDDFKIGEGKGIRRLIFDGWAEQTYTPYQLQQLKRLDQYLKAKQIKLDPRWNNSWRLRYMLSTGCDIQKCVNDMERFMGYISNVRELHLTRTVSKLLNEGAFYIMGKDCHYRPILVFDVQKLVQLQPTDQEIVESQTYFLEYVIKHYFIPGQVENWIALIDSGFQGLFKMVDSMKKAFSFLADTYRSRLFAAYNVRITTSISIIWGIVKRFLQQDTIDKINLFDQDRPEPLFQYAHPSQIEVKFGGTMPNIPQGSYWPPREWSHTYKLEKCHVDYMTRQQYTEFYNNGILRDTKIHEDNLILPVAAELRDNVELQSLKKIEKQFKTHLEECSQDRVIFEKDVEPYSKLPTSLSYNKLLMKVSNEQSRK